MHIFKARFTRYWQTKKHRIKTTDVNMKMFQITIKMPYII